MINSIKDVFDEEAGTVKIDAKLVNRIHNYLQSFFHKNSEYTSFFGSGLMGVHTVRFTPTDHNTWFDEVLEIDDISIKRRVISLDTVDASWARATDPFNLSCIWLLHALSKDTKLPTKKRHQAMMDTLMILQAKFLTSLMAHNFPYPADQAVAEATYAALSKKFALKVHGSWQKLLKVRSEDILSSKSIHLETFNKFNDDGAIIYMITDVQGRMREIIKKMLTVFYAIREEDSKTLKVSSIINLDGEKKLRDKERNATTYIRYIHQTIPNKSSFVRKELVDIVADIMHTMPHKQFEEALTYMSNNYGVKGEKEIQPLVDETMIHAFDFMSQNKSTIKSNDIGDIIIRLRAMYMSSRSTDPAVMKMRELAESIVEKAVDSRNSSVIAAIRTGVLIYIVLRTFTMKHYS